MPVQVDLTGRRFGLLVALEPERPRRTARIRWRCRCDCGVDAVVAASDLNSGHTRSCGRHRGALRGEVTDAGRARIGAGMQRW